jgi:large subunit ribosomal protein L19e
LLKVGLNRVWIDPEKIEKVESAITRDEIRKLIHEGAIKALPERGTSRGRKRIIHRKKAAGRRRGAGSRKGSRYSKKLAWVNEIRAIRGRLRKLRDKRMITKSTYRKLLLMAKGGAFRSVSHLHEYIETHKLARKR